MTTIILTHKGWFGICPVYFGDLGCYAPHVHERSPIFAPLMRVSLAMQSFAGWCLELMSPDYQWPGWALLITGTLDAPIIIEIDDAG